MDPPEPGDGDNGRRDSSQQSTPSSGLPHRPRNSPRTSTESGNVTAPIPDDEHGADLPLTLSASVILTGLPRDAHQALADAEALDSGKGTINRTGNVFQRRPAHDDSDDSVPTAPFSPDSAKGRLQSQRVAKVRNRGQLSPEEAGLPGNRLCVLLHQ